MGARGGAAGAGAAALAVWAGGGGGGGPRGVRGALVGGAEEGDYERSGDWLDTQLVVLGGVSLALVVLYHLVAARAEIRRD